MDLHSLLSGQSLIASGGILLIFQTIWAKINGVLQKGILYLKDKYIYRLVYTTNSAKQYEAALKFITEEGFLTKARSVSPSIINSKYLITFDIFNFALYKGTILFFDFSVRKLDTMTDNGIFDNHGDCWNAISQEETLNIYYFGIKVNLRNEIQEKINTLAALPEKEDMSKYYRVLYSSLNKADTGYQLFPKRLKESIFLPGTQLENIISDLTKFRNSEALYSNKCIPYKRTYLLEGIPGSGKTSLVKTLASEFNVDLIVIRSIEDFLHGDLADRIKDKSIKKECFCLIEEIDTFNLTRTTDENKTPNYLPNNTNTNKLQSLLTTLDGITTPHGLTLFMTTNYSHLLDPALVRPGRVDYRLNFKAPVDDQIIRACKFYCDAAWEPMYKKIVSTNPSCFAQIQEMLITDYLYGLNK